ncbi:DNA polymerase III subunit gamma and tau [Microbacterium betulae]|uniref:DNA-directed DNA polymerase n=1 Tax=Microbacterium betulae TaxID=2981139 RepID=A0AA97FJD9_9MICO|nr:DNA polymerase III subunit gamma and tau [Microbacterium sp. AB]WOF24058.1 DNA polymerase III subunit gamma and tau [Microbacterium sp. AB]
MTTALYRRYRPETFGEMIGQAQVTDPLMTALRGDRIGHAYLFSGPRGCGKTTSARILARCLNCAEGPTDTPCGTCDSCVELSRAGGGSLDVVEIDAASHNGVDDARDLRERAIFAPARDRFKIFILDEAHMVTPQGFNALLKLVEEPPEHVKFIFATTEPDKVIGTIRSRTHHYPFRLVPPAAMLQYVERLCAEEGVAVAQGVLPLVVRAGGGSPRDTLSILDQLIAGSEQDSVSYARAVALLGYTHGELLDEVVDAFAAADAAAAFGAVDRVVQTGQDPRRFVDDLLERLRDLIVIAATGAGASAVLRGVPADELERMGQQAQRLGADRLSRTADIVSAALDGMTGATSPRLQLELMIARVLTHGAAPAGQAVPSGGASATGAPASPSGGSPSERPAPATASPASPAAAPGAAPAAPPTAAPAAPPAAEPAAAAPPTAAPAVSPPSGPEGDTVPAAGWAAIPPGTDTRTPSEPPRTGTGDDRSPSSRPAEPQAPSPVDDVPPPDLDDEPPYEPADETPPARRASESAPETPPASESAGLTLPAVRSAWNGILSRVESTSRSSWLVLQSARPVEAAEDILTLVFTNQGDLATFKQRTPQGGGVSEDLRTAILDVLGIRVKYLARYDGGQSGPDGGHGRSDGPTDGPAAAPSAPQPQSPPESPRGDAPPVSPGRASSPSPAPRAAASYAAAPVTEWAVATIPGSALAVDDDPEEAVVPPAARVAAPVRDGEVVVPAAVPEDDDVDPGDIPPEPADVIAPAPPPAPPAPVVQARSVGPEGIQRYGEAVVRQVLGARFLHEEPYEPPTRFP